MVTTHSDFPAPAAGALQRKRARASYDTGAEVVDSASQWPPNGIKPATFLTYLIDSFRDQDYTEFDLYDVFEECHSRGADIASQPETWLVMAQP